MKLYRLTVWRQSLTGERRTVEQVTADSKREVRELLKEAAARDNERVSFGPITQKY